MPNQKSQPGQRNIASQGDENINNTGDNPTFNIYNLPLPERSAKHQLRAPVGDFVGRENEIAELIAALTNGGQASISGISGLGGIGKTELAMVVANRLRDLYPDAQLLVELRGTDPQPRKPEDALADCVRAFVGIEARLPDDLNTLVKLYRDSLSGKRVLVMLDNAADANQVHPFLVPAGCALLVTSCETISLPDMKRIRLEQLPPDKARDLLREIASRVAEAVADQICFLCGYLPLAVRAAASLLDVTPDLDPTEYAAELSDERKRLEVIGAEGVEIGVAASFNLSYQRLPDTAARVFRALAVFPASFNAAAAEAIVTDGSQSIFGKLMKLFFSFRKKQEANTVQILRELVRRNLVNYGAQAQRYRLHDLARLFAAAQASDDERADWQECHARHFCDLLGAANELYLEGGEQVSAGMTLYDSEFANIVAGQAWAASRADADDAAAQLCVEYPNAGLYVLMLRLHPRGWIRWLDAQLSAARKLKQRSKEGAALCNLGLSYTDLSETRKAIEFYKQALIIARETGDRHGKGSTLGNLGLAYTDLGDVRKAIEFHEQALLIHRESGDRRGEGNVLGNLGIAFANLGETRKAIEFYEQALIIDCEIGNRRGKGSTLGNLGLAYANLGETRKAIKFYEQALLIHREIGNRRGEGIALWNLALAREKLGDRSQAITCAEASLTIQEEIEYPFAPKVREQLAIWTGKEQ